MATVAESVTKDGSTFHALYLMVEEKKLVALVEENNKLCGRHNVPRPADVKGMTFLHLFTSPLGDEEQRMISVSRPASGHKNFAPNPLLLCGPPP